MLFAILSLLVIQISSASVDLISLPEARAIQSTIFTKFLAKSAVYAGAIVDVSRRSMRNHEGCTALGADVTNLRSEVAAAREQWVFLWEQGEAKLAQEPNSMNMWVRSLKLSKVLDSLIKDISRVLKASKACPKYVLAKFEGLGELMVDQMQLNAFLDQATRHEVELLKLERELAKRTTDDPELHFTTFIEDDSDGEQVFRFETRLVYQTTDEPEMQITAFLDETTSDEVQLIEIEGELATKSTDEPDYYVINGIHEEEDDEFGEPWDLLLDAENTDEVTGTL